MSARDIKQYKVLKSNQLPSWLYTTQGTKLNRPLLWLCVYLAILLPVRSQVTMSNSNNRLTKHKAAPALKGKLHQTRESSYTWFLGCDLIVFFFFFDVFSSEAGSPAGSMLTTFHIRKSWQIWPEVSKLAKYGAKS